MSVKSPLQELIKILSVSLLLQTDRSTAMKEQISYFLQIFIIRAQKFGLYLSQNTRLHNKCLGWGVNGEAVESARLQGVAKWAK